MLNQIPQSVVTYIATYNREVDGQQYVNTTNSCDQKRDHKFIWVTLSKKQEILVQVIYLSIIC